MVFWTPQVESNGEVMDIVKKVIEHTIALYHSILVKHVFLKCTFFVSFAVMALFCQKLKIRWLDDATNIT